MAGKIYMPELAPVMQRKYRLRWRFDYANRKTRRGVWDGTGKQTDPTGAWIQPKDGLVRAAIEAENLETQALINLVEVDGHEYAFMQWERHMPLSSGMVTGHGPAKVTASGRLAGLKLWTNDQLMTAYIDGTVAKRFLTTAEKRFDFAEHRAGT